MPTKDEIKTMLRDDPKLVSSMREALTEHEKEVMPEGIATGLGKLAHGGAIGSAHPTRLEELINPAKK